MHLASHQISPTISFAFQSHLMSSIKGLKLPCGLQQEIIVLPKYFSQLTQHSQEVCFPYYYCYYKLYISDLIATA